MEVMVHTLFYVVLWHCVWQPSYKTVYHQDDVASAREHSYSARSQSCAKMPSSTTSSGVALLGESVATSGSQRQPTGAQSTSHTQRSLTVSPPSDQQMASRPLPSSGTVQSLPPSGRQRLMCSVEVPGVGRASRVNHVEYCASCKVAYWEYLLTTLVIQIEQSLQCLCVNNNFRTM